MEERGGGGENHRREPGYGRGIARIREAIHSLTRSITGGNDKASRLAWEGEEAKHALIRLTLLHPSSTVMPHMPPLLFYLLSLQEHDLLD